jgi:uncharacterized protein with PIN domain
MRSKLISLEEHDAIIAEQMHDFSCNEPKRNGVACPRCQAELYDQTPNMILASNPPKKKIRCAKCGWNGYRLA